MKVGVVGAGNMGQRHARTLLAVGGCELCLYDAEAERLAQAAIALRRVRLTPCLAGLFAWHPDAVLICTPPDSHLDLMCQAARAGVRAVFCEKPLDLRAPTPDELALLSGVTTFVGCNLRYDDRLAELGERARAWRRIPGAFLSLWIAYDHARNHPDYRQGYFPRTGALFDAGWHLVDLALDWLGPARVREARHRPALALGLPDTDGGGTLLLDHDEGATSVISYDVEARCYHLGGSLQWTDAETVRSYDTPPGPEMFAREMQAFIRCARGEQESPNPVSQAAQTLGLLLACPVHIARDAQGDMHGEAKRR